MSPSRLDTPRAQSELLSRGFLALAAMTYGLMVLGALVRANGAGLACPDWPLCFGQVVPPFDVKVAFEWSHRALAGGVSIGLAALTVGLLRTGQARRVRGSLALAWGLLAVQVVLGGLTVLLRLAPWSVVAHLTVGTSFAITLLFLWRALAESAGRRRVEVARGVGAVGVVAAGVLALQILLGGMVSSSGAGPACGPVYPDCLGMGWFPTFEGLVGLHVMHRANGLLTVAAFSLLFAVARRAAGPIGTMAAAAMGLAWVQLGVGVMNVLLALPVEVTGLHTALAAALALLTSLIVREIWLAARARSVSASDAPRSAGAAVQVREGVG